MYTDLIRKRKKRSGMPRDQHVENLAYAKSCNIYFSYRQLILKLRENLAYIKSCDTYFSYEQLLL